MDEEKEDLPDCSVCLESLEKSSARLLPCRGIVCESCVEELLESNILDCPECGEEHSAENGVKTFPEYFQNQNKATFDAEVASKESQSQNEERCNVHGTEASIYCQEPYCQKTVLQIQKQEETTETEQVPTKSEAKCAKVDPEDEDEIKNEKTEKTENKTEDEVPYPAEENNVPKLNTEGMT